MAKNPFDDDAAGPSGPLNPFGDDDSGQTSAEAIKQVERAALKIRNLRRQLGSEGLSVSAMRELIDEVGGGLEAAARALRSLEDRS